MNKRTCWSDQEIQILMDYYLVVDKVEDIYPMLPGRTPGAIQQQAESLKLNRVKVVLDLEKFKRDFESGVHRLVMMKEHNISIGKYYRTAKELGLEVREMVDFGPPDEFERNYLTKQDDWLEKNYNTTYAKIKNHGVQLGLNRPKELFRKTKRQCNRPRHSYGFAVYKNGSLQNKTKYIDSINILDRVKKKVQLLQDSNAEQGITDINFEIIEFSKLNDIVTEKII